MQNSLDDIFGSSPPHAHDHPPSTTTTTTTAPQNEPSDLPSLRRQHVTAGYRDGLAASKSTQVQSGFDAGFPVGAQLGMRVGTILGILEGAIRGLEAPSRKGVRKVGAGGSATTKKGAGVPGRDVAAMGIGFEDFDSGAVGEGAGGATTTGLGSSAAAAAAPTPEETPREKKRAELLGLYRRAVRELDIRKVFEGVGGSADELAGDGGQLAEGIGKQQEMPETKLARQAEAVVAAWERRVQVALWEENMEALELKEVVG